MGFISCVLVCLKWVNVDGRSQFRFVFAKLSLRYVDDGYGELSEVKVMGFILWVLVCLK